MAVHPYGFAKVPLATVLRDEATTKSLEPRRSPVHQATRALQASMPEFKTNRDGERVEMEPRINYINLS